MSIFYLVPDITLSLVLVLFYFNSYESNCYFSLHLADEEA